eukprot:514349_1
MHDINNRLQHQELISQQSGIPANKFNITYHHEGAMLTTRGLINNLGLVSLTTTIQNMFITPFAIAETVIVTTRSIVMDNIQIIPKETDVLDPYYIDLRQLMSPFFIFVSITITDINQVTISNSNLNGFRDRVITVMPHDLEVPVLKKLQIINVNMRDTIQFINAANITDINIQNSTFINGYGCLFDIEFVNNIVIDSSTFMSYGRVPMMSIVSVQHIVITNNTFDFANPYVLLREEEDYLILSIGTSDIDRINDRSFVMNTAKISHMYVTSNYFGYNEESAKMISKPALYVRYTNVCFSNNTFHNYAIYARSSNLTSCFRPNMHAFCDNDISEICCDKYGGWNEALINKMSYFIIHDENIQPIRQPKGTGNGTVMYLDNMVFVIHNNVTNVLLPDVTHSLFVDVFITNNINFTYYYEICDILCHQVVNELFIAQIQMNCKAKDLYKEHIQLVAHGAQIVTHGTAHSVVLTTVNLNSAYYPGEFMKFNYSIIDKMGNIVSNYKHIIEIVIYVKYNNIIFEQSKIKIDAFGKCIDCESGVYFSSITLNDIGKHFILETQAIENDVVVSNVNVFINNCPQGFGVDAFNSHCTECGEDFYQLLPNSTEYCKSCKNKQQLSGFKCHGDDTILVSQNFWIAVQGITNNNDIFNDDLVSDSIISGWCPNSQCCQLNECNYLLDKNALCASGRDPNVPLCGACLPGFSEAMNNSNCCKCTEKNVYITWLFYPFCLSLVVTIYIMLSKSRKINTQTTDNIKTNFNKIRQAKSNTETNNLLKLLVKDKRFTEMVKFMFSKVIIYYQQSLYQILISGTVIINLSTISSFFNLSVSYWSTVNTDSTNGWCFINGLTSKYKILSNLIAVFMITLLVILSSFIMNKYSINQRQISISKALYTLLLLCISQTLSVIFQLLSCERILNTDFHFYFSTEKCYGYTWIFSFIGLIIIIFIF